MSFPRRLAVAAVLPSTLVLTTLVALLAPVGGLPGLAGPAGAAGPVAEAASKPMVRSTVTVNGFRLADEGRVVFYGRVRSPRPVCQRARLVKLRQVDQGARAGKSRTSRSGRWRIVFKGRRVDPDGTFRAHVARTVVRVDGRRVVCAPDAVRYDPTSGS
ncbi:hypothetical protein [Nocardioides sambongensis]|uniref:hypothetical protein n=1 Tax=Nocardioides sambongensis TaxID=2589074 RepID=UPI00112C71EF|nr:hypothetical protein [Nocardioides sambongensis]